MASAVNSASKSDNLTHLRRRSSFRPQSFASRRSSSDSNYSEDEDGSSVNIPLAVKLNGSISGLSVATNATQQRPCNKYGFFLDSDEASTLELAVPARKLKRRESKWLHMLVNEKTWSKYVVKRYKKVRNRCRKGIPHAVRGKAWLYLCGGHKQMRKEAGLFDRLDHEPGDEIINDEITKDLHRQFPSHQIFAEKDGYGQTDLYRILKAYSIMKPDIGYCQGQAPLASVLLMHLPAEEAFWTLVQLCDFFIPGYFAPGLETIQLHGDMLFSLLKRFFPAAHRLLKKQKIEPILYMTEWFMCLYSRTLPWPIVLRVWDMFMCEGIRVIFKVAIVMIGSVLGSNTPERKECKTMYETLQLLRNIPSKYLDEREFIDKIIKLDLKEKDLQLEHTIQSSNRKVKKAIEEKNRKAKEASRSMENLNAAAKKSDINDNRRSLIMTRKTNIKQFGNN
ncbi:TBC1 domain family member 10A [Halotydeus destructor]|nr:TBC1 domain family member 10A [Halotydeus destructor]